MSSYFSDQTIELKLIHKTIWNPRAADGLLTYNESNVFSSLTEDKLLILNRGDEDEHKKLTSKNYEAEVSSWP
mgnify:CR=1 FL=1